MSAITGYWDGGDRHAAERFCRAMLDALTIYGPDDRHMASAGRMTAGRNLFKLLPEDHADQGVLVGGDGSLLLAADLRIDNRVEFIAELGLAPRANPMRSDAALLLAGLERWGEAVLERIVGDFAFACFDGRRQRLILARDPLGQRPLFWHKGRDFFAFASMPNGLHALPGVPAGPNLDMAARFAALLPQRGDISYHLHIHRVEPGHLLTVTPDGVTSRRYWQPKRQELRLKSFDDYVDVYRATLDQAVASRLRGAGDLVASHLSGGWDSSAVTATAARLLSGGTGEVIAYTSVPAQEHATAAPQHRFADEAPLAAAAAALYPNIRHEPVRNPAGSAIAYLDRTEHLFQRPPFNLCNHGWLAGIRSAARQAGARVLLTGEIGNWTISSAPSTLLADFVRARRWADWAKEARGMVSQRRARLRGVMASSFGPWLPTPIWRAVTGLSAAPPLELPLRPACLSHLQAEINEQRFGPASRPKGYHERTAAGFLEMDFGQYRKGILGGWGIDKRDATADVRLIDLAMSLPIEMLLSNGQRRPLARAALADRLPPAVLDERRKGYQAADWHLGLTRDMAEVHRLLDRIEADPRAADLIDTGLLRRWLREMPTEGWERPEVIGRYRTSLLFALAAGHFIISYPG